MGHMHEASLLDEHLARDSQVFMQRGRVSGHGDCGVSAGGGGGGGGTAEVDDRTVEVSRVEGAEVVASVDEVAGGGGGAASPVDDGGVGGRPGLVGTVSPHFGQKVTVEVRVVVDKV